jgi:hypothetical protein
LNKFYEYQACVQPICTVFVRIVKGKKDQDKELIAIFGDNREILKKIIRIHDCNSLIMSSLLATLYNLIDFIDTECLFYILNFQRLREIFSIFKMNGFDQIHEVILHLVKGMLVKKNEQIKKDIHITNISDDEYTEIISIFSVALQFMRNRIVMSEFIRLAKWLSNLMAHMYTICNIISNTNLKSKLVNILIEKKIVDWLVDCLSNLNEKNIFVGLNSAFEVNDLNLINSKVMLFRTFFHCFNLIKTIKDLNPVSLVILFNFRLNLTLKS